LSSAARWVDQEIGVQPEPSALLFTEGGGHSPSPNGSVWAPCRATDVADRSQVELVVNLVLRAVDVSMPRGSAGKRLSALADRVRVAVSDRGSCRCCASTAPLA
jgi:hypothetical protein